MPESILDKHINQLPQEAQRKVHVLGTATSYKHNNKFYCQLCYFKNAQHIFLKYKPVTKVWKCPNCLYEIDTTLSQIPAAKDDVIAINDPKHSTIRPHIVPMKHFNIIEDKGTQLTDEQLANQERDELELPKFNNPKIVYHTASEAFTDMDEEDFEELEEDSEHFNDDDSTADNPSKMV